MLYAAFNCVLQATVYMFGLKLTAVLVPLIATLDFSVGSGCSANAWRWVMSSGIGVGDPVLEWVGDILQTDAIEAEEAEIISRVIRDMSVH